MAFDKTPDTWINDWSENGTLIDVPIASFPELTAAEADGSTGDIRKIWWAILQKLYNEYNALAAGDRPTKWVSTKTTSVNTTTGVVTHTFTNTIYTSVLTEEVVDE